MLVAASRLCYACAPCDGRAAAHTRLSERSATSAQALKRAYRIGTGQVPLRVYRLYLRNTLEERLLQLSDRVKGLEGLFKQGHARWARLAGWVVPLAGWVCTCGWVGGIMQGSIKVAGSSGRGL